MRNKIISTGYERPKSETKALARAVWSIMETGESNAYPGSVRSVLNNKRLSTEQKILRVGDVNRQVSSLMNRLKAIQENLDRSDALIERVSQ